MAQNRPTAAELIDAVATFLETDMTSAVTGEIGFRCRVAGNALRIVQRELTLRPPLDAEEQTRLVELLGMNGTLDQLNRELSNRILSGDIAIEDPSLLRHLKQTIMAKASIDNPKYSGYLQAIETGESN